MSPAPTTQIFSVLDIAVSSDTLLLAIDNHNTFHRLISYGSSIMRNAGVEVDTVSFFNKKLLVAVYETHSAFQHYEYLFAVVLKDSLSFRLYRKS